VTSRYDISKNGYLPFPSFYWPDKQRPEPGEEFYNCSIKILLKNVIGACMTKRPCFVSPEMVNAALGQQKWNPSMNAICSLEKQIHLKGKKTNFSPPYSLNLIIIGGSMTKGSETDGKCICIKSEDSRCANIDRSHFDMSFCSWATHFTNWLKSEFPMIQFNVSDLSRSGMASYMVPDMVGHLLHQLTLSHRDIIIIDESVNDVSMRNSMDLLRGDVESMIRRLYGFTKGNHPTMIMIEQYPHTQKNPLQNQVSYSNRILPGDYAMVYRNLSEHYHLPYYSMREVYWTFFNENITKSHRYPFSVYGNGHVHTHPPWNLHNFMADVIADCFLDSLSRCRQMRESGSSRTHQRYILPPPYYSQTEASNYCDVSDPTLLEAHAKNYFHPKNLTEFELGDGAKQVGWREYVDYHNTSGWMINDLSAPSQRDLSFPINNIFPRGQSWTGHIVVIYLKSYEGMGVGKLFLCGLETPLWLDGLSETDKFSVPFMASMKINSQHAANCNKLPLAKRTLMIRYRPDHRTPRDQLRHHKKLKILSLQICSKTNH
jgi:hypothetical protein